MSCLSLPAIGLAGALLALVSSSEAEAWGAAGHRMIGQAAIAALPDEVPAFVRTPQVAQDVGELDREPDRWRESGKTHDSTRDPAHFLDLDDNGKVLGGPVLAALPPTRAEYESDLRAVSADTYHAGYLPYAIVDGWQQLAKDFAYWRVLKAAIPRERDPARKAWLERDLVRREGLTIRDLGVWAHFVGDASQPMHVSVHFNGWGPFPNPNGYTQNRVHTGFEGDYVRRNLDTDQIRAAMAPPAPCEDPVEVCTARYLAATNARIEPYFVLQKDGGFANADPRGAAFVRERVSAGAAVLRDLVTTAWRASAKGTVGHPSIPVEQVVKGGADPYDSLYGDD